MTVERSVGMTDLSPAITFGVVIVTRITLEVIFLFGGLLFTSFGSVFDELV